MKSKLNRLSLLISPCLLLGACSQADSELASHPGKQIWQDTCQVCHQTGLAGAPIMGDQKAWASRIKRGKDSLYTHALEGWGDMPARGGNANLSDQQVMQAVDYMLANSQ